MEWSAVHTLSVSTNITSICWNQAGTCLLTGGISITLWEYKAPLPTVEMGSGKVEWGEEGEEGEGVEGKKESEGEVLKEIWSTDVSSSVVHLAFSPKGKLFASCGEVSCVDGMHAATHCIIFVSLPVG